MRIRAINDCDMLNKGIVSPSLLRSLCDILARMMNICEKKPSCKISVQPNTSVVTVKYDVGVPKPPNATAPSTSLAYRHRQTSYPRRDEDGSDGVSHVKGTVTSGGDELGNLKI